MRFKIKEKQKHSKSVDVSFKSEMDYRWRGTVWLCVSMSIYHHLSI